MLKIRRAGPADKNAVLELLKNPVLDLFYQKLKYKDFWVAEKGRQIVGCLQLEDLGSFLFLGSLGVDPNFQHQGIAKRLVTEVLRRAGKDVYLYTIIPEFFKRLGFQSTRVIPNLPPRTRFECERCQPGRCETMVRKTHAG